MSAQINSHTNAQSSVANLLSVLAFPAVIAVNIARRIQERRELNQLLSMSDYALHDIGLQRHQIERAYYQSVWSRSGE